MEDLNFWLLFLSAALILNIAPGPDLLYILTKTMASGKKVGIASSLGVCTGALFHVVAASIGISAILVTSAYAFTIVKIIGALYLFYLAYQSLVSKGTAFDINDKFKVEESFKKVFIQGILIDLFNPKVAIFFMAFLPQFVRQGHGSVTFQLLYLGLIIIAIAIIVETIFVLISSKLINKIKNNKNISRYLDKIIGMFFIFLGIKLLTQTNK